MNNNPIIEELNEIAALLSQLRKPPQEQLGALPEGYLDGFLDALQEQIEIQEELKQHSPLLQKLKETKPPKSETVPEGYFNSFEERLIVKLESFEDLETPILDGLKKDKNEQLGDLPEGYFGDFDSRLNERLAKIEDSELETPLLTNLKKVANEQLGELPKGYFDGFEERLELKLEGEKAEPKLVPLQTKPQLRKVESVYIMAAAASVLLFIVSTLWLIKGTKTSSPFAYELMANMNVDEGINTMELAEASAYLIENLDEMETEDILESLNEESIQQLSQANMIPMMDTLPPVKNPKIKDPINLNTDNKHKGPNPSPKQTEGGLTEELEDEVAEETDLEELFGKISDSDLDALEAALLKPKKKETTKK